MAAIIDQGSPVINFSPSPPITSTAASSSLAPCTESVVPGAVPLGNDTSHLLPSETHTGDDLNGVSGRLTIVRVKRKRSDVPTDSLWLEVGGGGAFKRMHFDGLAIDDGKEKEEEEEEAASAPPHRSLFRLLDTLPPSTDATSPATSSALLAAVAARRKRWAGRVGGWEERQERERVALREQELASARTARYQHVRRARQVDRSDDATSHLLLYDVERVEEEEEEEVVTGRARRERAKKEAAAREGQLLCNFLPLLREMVPEAGKGGGEEDPGVDHSGVGEEYVFDLYCVEEESGQEDRSFFDTCPVVQILEDEEYDFREGRVSDADSEDSNDENNEGNDYPDEEDDEDDEDGEGTHRTRERGGMWELGSDDEIDPYGDHDINAYDTVAYDEEEAEMMRQRRNGSSKQL